MALAVLQSDRTEAALLPVIWSVIRSYGCGGEQHMYATIPAMRPRTAHERTELKRLKNIQELRICIESKLEHVVIWWYDRSASQYPWEWTGVLNAAVESSSPTFIAWAGSRPDSPFWQEDHMEYAVRTERKTSVQALVAQRCPWSEGACAEAARLGLQMLQYVRSFAPPCPWDENIYVVAADIDSVEIAKWAQSEGCPMDDIKIIERAQTLVKSLDMIKLFVDAFSGGDKNAYYWCNDAIICNDLDLLKELRILHYTWTEDSLRYAIQFGDLELVQWVWSNGAPRENVHNITPADIEYPEVLAWYETQYPS